MCQSMNDNQYDMQKQTSTTELQTPGLGHANTKCSGVELDSRLSEEPQLCMDD